MALPRSPIGIPGSQINDLRLALNDVLSTVKSGSAYGAATDFFPLGRPAGSGIPAGTIDPAWIDTAAIAPIVSAVIGMKTLPSRITRNSAGATGYTAPPTDSAPSSSQGTDYISLSYTPKRADSFLRVRFHCPYTHMDSGGSNGQAIFAIHRDGGASAVGAASILYAQANKPTEVYVEVIVPSNATVSTSFTVRFGAVTGGATVHLLEWTDLSHLYGSATGVSTLTVEEIIIPSYFVSYNQAFNGNIGSSSTSPTTGAAVNGTIAIPSGATQLVIRAWGGGGGGGASDSSFRAAGGGGGAGLKKTVTVAPSDWGQNITYSVGGGGGGFGPTDNTGTGAPGGNSTITYTGTFSLNLTAGYGFGGQGAGGFAAGGAGGTATGGDINAAGVTAASTGGSSTPGGNSGTIDSIFGAGGPAYCNNCLAGQPGGGGGGHGASSGNYGGRGGPGRVEFIWS